ncbi:iron uptake transporter deferrochelatase/peroxidase subunit [Cellulomonas sp. PhB143]|uniref:iron uptake transporter deferrochelatase/peroxidase subunit n=1 Tax=Cellulomonas sp. PhB143 TaxID=2485186 RepID=UPI000F468AC9|nr:iron uptake transporter deferrochelatase/peroxidase subunit [Cellulomonas sp. PhB143]ROS76966.1 deferrochelatase/peroxidase EfeB [Cellulomonas sp. PhB143]
MSDPTPAEEPRRGVSRRALLGGVAGALGVGAAAGFAGASAAQAGGSSGTGGAGGASPGSAGSAGTAFAGAHQAGITTRVQEHLHFATFDVTTASREELVGLLRAWTLAASRMTRGLPAGELGPTSGPYEAPPDDTGEVQGLGAAGLTITFGLGPSLFRDAGGTDRFGLDARRPALLEDLPHFPGDMLEDPRCGGDLAVQACADDPQVAVHAVRNLSRIAFGTAAVRWSQLGYGRTSTTTTSQSTPRNLFGFKDGTANIKAEEPEAAAEHVWVDPDDDAGAAWLAGGSYLVARRIRMMIETWDRSSLREQEQVVGRTKASGAPLSGGQEHTEPDLAATGGDGAPLVDTAAHVRLAHPSSNGGARMLRRGYNYTDGSDGLGRLDAGLFFLAYVRDPATQYVPMQNRLARDDAMSEYLRHTGSGLWAVPPGVPVGAALGGTDGAYVGQALFEA